MRNKFLMIVCVLSITFTLVACANNNTTPSNENQTEENIEKETVDSTKETTSKDETISSGTEESETANKEENKPDYTVVDVSYTRYTMFTCSIRDYPGVSGEEVGILAKNTKVNVIGECNNGWLKIEYKDTGAFIRALNLSDAETIIEESTPTETPTPTPEPTPTPHEHSYVETIIKESICYNAGIKLYSCDCGHSYEKEYSAGHIRDGIRVTIKEPTCEDSGTTAEHCVNCGKEIYNEQGAPATGHEPWEYWIYHHGTGTYRRGCNNCQKLLDETTEKPEGVEIRDFYPRPVN